MSTNSRYATDFRLIDAVVETVESLCELLVENIKTICFPGRILPLNRWITRQSEPIL